MPPGLHGMLWSFLLWRDATRRAQVTTNETSTGKEVNRDCGNAMTSYAYASRRKGFANPYSTMEPFCTTRRLASLIREQACEGQCTLGLCRKAVAGLDARSGGRTGHNLGIRGNIWGPEGTKARVLDRQCT